MKQTFADVSLAEITSPDFPHERLIACYNAQLAKERAENAASNRDRGLHVRRREAAPVVHVLDHLHVPVQPGARERLAVPQSQARFEISQRH